MRTAPIPTSPDYRQAFERDGYAIVRGLYDAATMLDWKESLKAALDRPKGDHSQLVSGVHVWFESSLPEPLLSAMGDDKVVPILRRIIGPNIEFLSAKAVFKNAVTKFPTPWHQDWFYWGGAPKLSIWIALDDATEENGCLLLIPGSHKRVFPKQVIGGASGFANRIKDEDLAGLPRVSGVCARGDAVFFHDLLAHSSHPNRTGGDRWSLISTYRDGSVSDESTVWKSSLVVCGVCVNPGALRAAQ